MYYLVDWDVSDTEKWIMIVEGNRNRSTVIEILKDDKKIWHIGDDDYRYIDHKDFVYENEDLQKVKEYSMLHLL